MINITYLIKRVLTEYDKTEADKIQLNISKKTLKFYDEWYDSYYYQNKIEEISKKCNLEITAEVYHKLRLKLQKAIEKIKEKYGRKRVFNISYVIKRALRNMIKYKQVKYKNDKLQHNLSQKKYYSFMMSIKKLNNFIQNLYKILYYTFMKKNNTKLQSQIQELMI